MQDAIITRRLLRADRARITMIAAGSIYLKLGWCPSYRQGNGNSCLKSQKVINFVYRHARQMTWQGDYELSQCRRCCICGQRPAAL